MSLNFLCVLGDMLNGFRPTGQAQRRSSDFLSSAESRARREKNFLAFGRTFKLVRPSAIQGGFYFW